MPRRTLLVALAVALLAACSHRTSSAAQAAAGPGAASVLATVPAGAPRVAVAVGAEYSPDTVEVKVGQPVVVVFTRTTDETCGTAVEIPALHVTRPLPLHTPVEVALAPTSPGAIAFTCGMHMMQGKILVE